MNTVTNKQTVLELELEKLQKENELMRQLGTASGFFEYYFNVMLPIHDTRKEAFYELNDRYEKLFGEPRYSGHESFRRSISNWLNSRKNR